MKKGILFGLITMLLLPIYCTTVYMNNGLKYEGYYEAKLDGNIYLLNGKTVYELPVVEIRKIKSGLNNITADYLSREDFSKINLSSNEYDIITFGYIQSEITIIDDFNKELLNMSDREFAIYEMTQQQQQADEVSKKIDRVSNTMWTIWGISIGVSIIAVIAVGS